MLTKHLISIDMINIFEVFLPQLLRYPNPNDPLNGEAAALLMRHPAEYEAKVKGGQTRFPHTFGHLMTKLQSTCRGSRPKKRPTLLQARQGMKMRMKMRK